MICRKSDNDSIEKTVFELKAGKIVIVPTDTVYGFSGIINEDFDTDAEIRRIKGREKYKPFIRLISSPDDIYKYTDDEIPEKLIKYWPGPLTIIVRLKEEIVKKEFAKKEFSETEFASGAGGVVTAAFRCPGDEWLRTVIKECSCPIYSTSVNRSGSPVLDEEEKIIHEFDKEVSLIVADGDRKESLPSTIIKITEEGYEVIRAGALEI